MRFGDSETQKLLRDTARSYLAGKFPWERLYALEEPGERLSDGELAGFAEQGWFGLLAPERAGGSGLSLLEAAVVIEEFGYAAVPAPVAVGACVAYLLSHAGPHAADLLTSPASGRQLFTVVEASRRRGRPPLLADGTVPLSASNGRITGVLPLVPFATIANVVVAPLAADGRPAIAAIPLAGARIEPLHLLDRSGCANVHVEDASSDRCVVLATGERAEALREQGDALLSALSLIELAGMMQRIVEMTTQYISNRVQFGRPIGSFQAARHRAAELLMQTETTRWAAYHALGRFQEDPTDTDEIWLAKHWAVRAADRVYQISHLLHGGVGVGMEYPLHLLTQSLAAFAVRGGTMDEMVDRTLEPLNIPAADAEGR